MELFKLEPVKMRQGDQLSFTVPEIAPANHYVEVAITIRVLEEVYDPAPITVTITST